MGGTILYIQGLRDKIGKWSVGLEVFRVKVDLVIEVYDSGMRGISLCPATKWRCWTRLPTLAFSFCGAIRNKVIFGLATIALHDLAISTFRVLLSAKSAFASSTFSTSAFEVCLGIRLELFSGHMEALKRSSPSYAASYEA
jgi:hypothetical protein